MGKLKLTSKKCPGCTQFYQPKDSGARIAIRFRIAGSDMEYCPSCSARERFKLEVWLASEKKQMRTVPQFNTKTKKRTLVILTDPQDYRDDPKSEIDQVEHVGEDGLLIAPSQADVQRFSKPD